MSELALLLNSERVVFLDDGDKERALQELVRIASRDPRIADGEALLQAVKEREEVMSTAIGVGVAVPHARIASVAEIVVAVAISRVGVDYEAFDGQPVHILVLVAAPEKGHGDYLKVLARVSKVLRDDQIRKKLVHSSSPDEVVRLLSR